MSQHHNLHEVFCVWVAIIFKARRLGVWPGFKAAGPAPDGGFWLVGVKRPTRAMFDGIGWSQTDTLQQTIAALRGRRIALLDQMSDVDTGADLA